MPSEDFDVAQRLRPISNGHKQWAAHHELDPHQVGQQTVRHGSSRRTSFVPATIGRPSPHLRQVPITHCLQPRHQPCGTREIERQMERVTAPHYAGLNGGRLAVVDDAVLPSAVLAALRRLLLLAFASSMCRLERLDDGGGDTAAVGQLVAILPGPVPDGLSLLAVGRRRHGFG
jgi:hypothetical protein